MNCGIRISNGKSFYDCLYEGEDDIPDDSVIHTMPTIELYNVRGKVRLELFATVNGSVFVTKESPTMILILICDIVKHVYFHIPELIYDVFGNCELRSSNGCRLEVVPCSDLHNFW